MSENFDFKAFAQELNKAVIDFKAAHQADLDGLREAVDAHSVMLAAQQMNGYTGGAEPKREQQPVHAAAGLRGGAIAAHYKKRANAAGEDDSITLVDFMRGVAGMKCTDAVKASLAVGTDSAGGYAVPNIVMPGILDALVDQSALLTAGASIKPTEGAKSITTAAVDSLPKPAWRKELGAIAESQPTFRGVVATPRSLACIVRISRELLADADDMNRAITMAVSQAFAAELDRVGLVGSGEAPEPLGLYGMPGIAKIQQKGAAFAYADMLAAYQAQLEHKAPAPTAAIMAPRTLVGLGGLVDTTGQPLNPPPLLSGVRQLSTNGVPVNLGTGNAKSLVFIGNFNTVQYTMRESLNIGVLREAYAKTGEIGFLCHARVDVIATYPQAITVIEGVTSAAE